MKDGKFETRAEIWRHLLEGGKVAIEGNKTYLFLKGDELYNSNGYKDGSVFNYPEQWSIYEEPKPKKKVALYRYTYILGKGCDGVRANMGKIFQSEFTECSFREYDDGYGKLLLTESKEVEYDDV